jgi:NhaA family Na+:H+ antiporter
MDKTKTADLYHYELISGILLIISFIAAICVANIDSLQELYKDFVFSTVTFRYAQFVYKSPLIQVVNDGFMTLFFLLIGLELKFHLVCGEFQDKNNLVLPGVAAIGGIVAPAVIYWAFNYDSPETFKGWAIPIATDTAFMLGILSFFRRFIPTNLRAFIIGFSLIDDAIALLILAVFYTHSSSVFAMFASVGLIVFLFVLNRLKVMNGFYYIMVGAALWVAMVQAGVHGTLCGVIVALAIPVQMKTRANPSFQSLKNVLRPIVYYLILPLFSFVNAGISFDHFSVDIFKVDLVLGIILGLFVGKQVGIFLCSYLAIKLKWCSLPENVCWGRFYSIAVLGGIGFTLSLFIGDLAFEVDEPNYYMRVSVIIGSLLSAIVGTAVLCYLFKKSKDHLD